MSKILITGGSGVLGRQLTPRLKAAGHTVRILSRSARASKNGVEWTQGQLATGEGLAEAVQNMDVIIHAASSPVKTKQVDVEGTKALLKYAREAEVSHFIYISIVGVDVIPFSYYQAKFEAEKIVETSDVPWSIQRATQFYDFVDRVLNGFSPLPLMSFVPGNFRLQPIDTGEVADRICRLVEDGPGGRLPDIGGPEVFTFKELARPWLDVRSQRRALISLPLPGKVASGYRKGWATTPDNVVGEITWAEWLSEKYGIQEERAVRETA